MTNLPGDHPERIDLGSGQHFYSSRPYITIELLLTESGAIHHGKHHALRAVRGGRSLPSSERNASNSQNRAFHSGSTIYPPLILYSKSSPVVENRLKSLRQNIAQVYIPTARIEAGSSDSIRQTCMAQSVVCWRYLVAKLST